MRWESRKIQELEKGWEERKILSKAHFVLIGDLELAFLSILFCSCLI